jgi:hypothetical protein
MTASPGQGAFRTTRWSVLRAAVVNANKVKPPAPLELARAQALLGGALLGRGQSAEAKQVLLAAEPVLARGGDVKPAFLRAMRLRLADACEAMDRAAPDQGHAARAAEWKARAAEATARK